MCCAPPSKGIAKQRKRALLCAQRVLDSCRPTEGEAVESSTQLCMTVPESFSSSLFPSPPPAARCCSLLTTPRSSPPPPRLCRTRPLWLPLLAGHRRDNPPDASHPLRPPPSLQIDPLPNYRRFLPVLSSFPLPPNPPRPPHDSGPGLLYHLHQPHGLNPLQYRLLCVLPQVRHNLNLGPLTLHKIHPLPYHNPIFNNSGRSQLDPRLCHQDLLLLFRPLPHRDFSDPSRHPLYLSSFGELFGQAHQEGEIERRAKDIWSEATAIHRLLI